MDCYNCGELGHLAHQCTKPKKDKYKNKYKGKKDNSSNEDEDEKKKIKPYKKDGKKKDFHKKKKNGKAYIVGDWLMDIDSSSCSSDDDSCNTLGVWLPLIAFHFVNMCIIYLSMSLLLKHAYATFSIVCVSYLIA